MWWTSSRVCGASVNVAKMGRTTGSGSCVPVNSDVNPDVLTCGNENSPGNGGFNGIYSVSDGFCIATADYRRVCFLASMRRGYELLFPVVNTILQICPYAAAVFCCSSLCAGKQQTAAPPRARCSHPIKTSERGRVEVHRHFYPLVN